MTDDLFTYPKQIPEALHNVPMYRTEQQQTYSQRHAAANPEFSNRVDQYRALFKISSPALETANFVLFREPDHTLELFRPSNSLRWAHNELAYRETPPRKKLPGDKEMHQLAAKSLQDFQLENPHAEFESIVHSQIVVSTSPKDKGTVHETEVHAVYRFNIGGHPIFGPGAKLRASFVEGGQMSRLLSFWREPVEDKSRRVITPQEALKRFTNDPRFMRLSAETAVVNIHDIRFGYYALPPTEIQRYLIPVYAVKGTAKTKEFPQYDFTHYVVAVDISRAALKKAAVVANPASCTIF